MKKIINIQLIFFLAIVFIFNGCKEPEFETATSFDVLIGEFLEEDSATYSEFTKILNLTGNMSFLKAYGTYTCFVPTNEAIEAYKTEKNVSNIEDIDLEELADLVKYHVILDTLSTTEFTDGKLRTPNMYGQYLLVSTVFEDGESKLYLNRYSEIGSPDLRQSNGIIHSINSVLQPITESAAELLEMDSKYAIFTQALKETGYFETLSYVSPKTSQEKHWFTVFAQTDESLALAGINSYEDLKTSYCNTGDPTNPEDSLNLYMAYHILDSVLLYMGDLVLYQAQETMAPSEVVTIRLNSDSVKLNEDYFNGELERGVYIVRESSDQTAANGVIHTLEENLHIKVRYPFAVYFDVCDQPELRKMVDIWRVNGQSVTLSNGQLENISWHSDNTIQYVVDNGGSLNPGSIINADYFKVTLRTAVIRWIEFQTPLLVKGNYKVWICTRNTTSRKPKYTVDFNGKTLPNIIDNLITLPGDPWPTDGELVAMGLKRYNFVPADSLYFYSDKHGRVVAQLAGTIEVPTTGNHSIRFDVINNEMGGLWIDLIQFIPSDMDQVWPRIKGDGELVYDYPEGYVPIN